MKNRLYLFLIIVLVLFSCNKEDSIFISGKWIIDVVITTDIHKFPSYYGEMILIQDENDQLTGNIELYDKFNFYAYAELLPGGFVTRNNEIYFETYAWLVNDSISTLTLTYSGTVTPPSKDGPGYYNMSGIFNSGKKKIGDWSAKKR